VNVSKHFGDVVAVRDVNLEIADGELMVLVGPSGCGKSTVLRLIAGLEELTSGEIWIDDKRIDNVLPKDGDIAMVFQNYALYPHMSVYENIAFGLKLRRVPRREIGQRVAVLWREEDHPSETMTVQVSVVEPLGSELIVHGELAKSELVAKLDPGVRVTPESELTLVVDSRKVHLFDRQSERSLLSATEPQDPAGSQSRSAEQDHLADRAVPDFSGDPTHDHKV
jgi:ABC-type sugar transport system ATPase subunit